MAVEIPASWLNVARAIEHIEKGQMIAVEMEGGFARKEAPCSGMLVRLARGGEVFVPAPLIDMATISARLAEVSVMVQDGSAAPPVPLYSVRSDKEDGHGG